MSKTAVSNPVAVNTHNLMKSYEFADLVRGQVNALMKDSSIASYLPPIMCWGSPGCGKSSIVKSVAEELGIGFIDVRLAQMEPCDIKGLPVADREKKTMEWYINGVWPKDKNSKGILFLDELSACDRSIAVAAYELILDRRLGDLYQVPDGWYIVAAGNLTTDRAVANTMSSALANRFLHVELEADSEAWMHWATQHDVHPSVIGYIAYRPDCLFSMEKENLERGWPSPRSWERVSQMTKLYSDNENILRKAVYGLVGTAKGVEYMEFHRLNKKFDDVLSMMYGNAPINIPGKNDERYAFTSSLVYQLWRGADADDQRKRIDGFMNIVSEMPSDFAAMGIINAMSGSSTVSHTEACNLLYHNKNYGKWVKKNADVLKRHFFFAGAK